MKEAHQLLTRLKEHRATLAVAESFTGGILQDHLTDVPGSSKVFRGGVVAYHDSAKRRLLGVRAATLKDNGAVSAPVAKAMARGVRRLFGATMGIATTGIAGPTGATKEKAVGLSFVAVSYRGKVLVEQRQLAGSRQEVKEGATLQALTLAAKALSQNR